MSDLTFTQGADPVAVVNDQSGNQLAINSNGSINLNNASSTSVSQVVLTANTNATLLATNTNRKQAVLFTVSQPVYVKLGVTASATSFTYKILANNTTLEINGYTGQIDIFSQNGQTVNVTELT